MAIGLILIGLFQFASQIFASGFYGHRSIASGCRDLASANFLDLIQFMPALNQASMFGAFTPLFVGAIILLSLRIYYRLMRHGDSL